PAVSSSLETVLVSCVLLLKISAERLGKVHSRLVSKADDYPHHISEFISKVSTLVRLLFSLLPVSSGDDPGNLSHFFRQNRHVCQFTKIADTGRPNPLVNLVLCFLDSHS